MKIWILWQRQFTQDCADNLNLNFRHHRFSLTTTHISQPHRIQLDPALSLGSTFSSALEVSSPGFSPSIPKIFPLLCRATNSSSASSHILLAKSCSGLRKWKHLFQAHIRPLIFKVTSFDHLPQNHGFTCSQELAEAMLFQPLKKSLSFTQLCKWNKA